MFSALVLLASTLVAISSAQLCPPAELLDPCGCMENLSYIHCNRDTDLKAVFDRVSPLVGEDVVFDDLRIAGQASTELPANIMTSLKFRRITIEANHRLESIHPDAFNATYDVTTFLNLSDNELMVSNSTFQFIQRFQQADEIWIRNNQLRQFPDDPFEQELPQLKTLRLEGNGGLMLWGARTFAKMPSLQQLDLQNCAMSLEDLSADAFEGISSGAEVDLRYNDFSKLPQDIFEPILDSAGGLQVGGQRCYFFCDDIPLDCDELSGWLCGNEAAYQPKLKGFFCRAESGGDYVDGDIWDWCHAQNNNTNTSV